MTDNKRLTPQEIQRLEELADEGEFERAGNRTGAERLAELIRETTAARGADLWAVEVEGLTAAEWARMTDRSKSTVSRNVRRARRQRDND